jgi:hypothetical protein
VPGERIEHNLYDLLEILVRARFTRQRQPLLEQANLTLEILWFQVRLDQDLQCLQVDRYAFAARAIDETGGLVEAGSGVQAARNECNDAGYSSMRVTSLYSPAKAMSPCPAEISTRAYSVPSGSDAR